MEPLIVGVCAGVGINRGGARAQSLPVVKLNFEETKIHPSPTFANHKHFKRAGI
jgi:hypothetical protein